MEQLLISACLLGQPCRYDGASKPLPEQQLFALRERFKLVPVCPETAGGLSTPRIPSERRGERVVNRAGDDVTEAYRRGAGCARALAKEKGCRLALLKERSPACGCGEIYDGSFTARRVPGNGVAAEALLKDRIQVYGESKILELIGGTKHEE